MITTEQIKSIQTIVNPQLTLLLRIKKDYHQNKWTTQFNSLVSETKEKLIWDIENYLLNPIETIAPLTRTFSKEDEPVKHEISRKVFELFKTFNEEYND